MHESRMIAEVWPSGVCAMLKVSGSRMAMPLAPPSPGRTPMMTPSTTPVNMNTRFCQVSATAKPCNSDWISSTRPALKKAEPGLHRSLGQGHEEPALEDQKKQRARSERHHRHLPPRVLAEPAHEKRDVQDRRDVDAQPADQRYVDHRRNQHAEHQLELASLDEALVLRLGHAQGEHERKRRRHADDQAEVKREVAGLRAVRDPAHAQPQAVVDDDRAEDEKTGRHPELGGPGAKRGASAGLLRHASALPAKRRRAGTRRAAGCALLATCRR